MQLATTADAMLHFLVSSITVPLSEGHVTNTRILVTTETFLSTKSILQQSERSLKWGIFVSQQSTFCIFWKNVLSPFSRSTLKMEAVRFSKTFADTDRFTHLYVAGRTKYYDSFNVRMAVMIRRAMFGI
jgi:hypothetical protein